MTGLRIERVDGIPVASPSGDVDAATAARVRDELVAAVADDVSDIVFDLGETRYVDSAGLDMLFRLNQRLRQRRTTLRVVIPATSQLARLVEIVGMPAAMPLYATVAEAVQAALSGGCRLGSSAAPS